LKKFAIIGVGGYIARRHLQAIKETKNKLIASMDINDSVGILDKYFPEADFFTNFEDFSNYVKDFIKNGQKIDYIVICSPNYLHFSHIKFALENNIDVICEKPLVLIPNQLNRLQYYEKTYGTKVNSILQLRLHPSILALQEKVRSTSVNKIFDVKLTYLTSRGKWYLKSWKGVDKKSGGVATNIGVHFYDMLHFIFGKVKKNEVHFRDQMTSCGYLEYDRARVRWFLSIDASFIPKKDIENENLTFRKIDIEGEELESSCGFVDMHTLSYMRILDGQGYDIKNNRAAIETVFKIRNLPLVTNPQYSHPLFEQIR